MLRHLIRIHLWLLLIVAAPLRAQEFQTSASAAWVYDVASGTVLYEKNADLPLPPASMSKLMTIYMAFEAVRSGQLTLDTTLPVSEHAMSYGGSSMFLNTNDRPTVAELLRGMIVLSGNDATVVVAEALSPDGTEPGFAARMTSRAREMGLEHSAFINASGWPAPGHVMSVHDLGRLAIHIIEDFPEFYPLFSETEFLYDGRVPSNTQNRNPILGLGIGADGLKTGHTTEAGYGLVGSAVQGGRRIVFVITGLPTEADRRTEAERIVNWAFRQFALREVGRAGQRLATAEVWMGETGEVGLILPEPVELILPAAGGAPEAHVVYQEPITAPVTAGQPLAELVITRPGLPEVRLPLVAESDVAPGGFGPRMRVAVKALSARAGLTGAAETPTPTLAAPQTAPAPAPAPAVAPVAPAPADPDAASPGLDAGD